MDVLFLIPPPVVLGFILATFTTFIFHALFGRRDRSGLFYRPFGGGGIAAGAIVSTPLGTTYLLVGGLPLLGGIAGCVVGLLLVHLILA